MSFVRKFFQIVGADTAANADDDNAVAPIASKLCGRQFNIIDDNAFNDQSVCSKLIINVNILIYGYFSVYYS